MIRAATGISAERASGRAGREAAAAAMERAGIRRAEVVLLYASADHFSRMEELVGEVRGASGARHVVGCSGYGVLTEEGEVEEGPGVALLVLEAPGMRLLPFLVEGLRDNPRRAGRQVARLARGAGGRPLAVMLPDTYNLNGPELLGGLAAEAEGTPVVGGGASEEGSLRRTFQFLDGRLATDAVAGLVMGGAFDYRLGVTQAYLPVGEPLMVTGAGGNFIHELGGKPAFEAFAQAAGPELMADIQRAAA
ncbi:MAG: FIST N-terminal domain-containing protein, partial [Nitrospinota bacterium]